MDSNLYALLAAQHKLDEQQKQQTLQLAAFTKLLSTLSSSGISDMFSDPTNVSVMAECWNQANKSDTVAMKKPSVATTTTTTTIPFDSPFDQSLGSPASTRDFQESPLQDYEFDFGNGVDAPLFPDHGTQQSSHNDNLLSGLPLFGNELALSQSVLPGKPLTSSQSTQQQQPMSDFSFDASTQGLLNFGGMGNSIAATVNETAAIASSPDQQQSVMQSSFDSQDGAGFNQFSEISASFVRECSRMSETYGVDHLQRALRKAGWGDGDELAASIVSSVSSRSSSPSASIHHTSESSPSVSPMVLPAAATALMRKQRSSLQSSPREPFATSAHRSAKRFFCPDCNKQFDRAFNLRTHSLTHVKPDDRDKPFVCPWTACNKPFSRKYDAERHYKTVHARRGEIASPKRIQEALSGLHGLQSPSTSSLSFNSDVDLANG